MSGQKVLLVHGAWHGAWCWDDNWVPYLTNASLDPSTIELHVPARQGDTRRMWTRMGTYVDRVRDRLEQLGPETIVVGHSMGGLVVQRALEKTNAKGMALLASVPHVGVIPATARTLRRAPGPTMATIATLNMWPLVASPELTRADFFTDRTPVEVVDRAHARLQNESYTAYVSMMLRRGRPKLISAPTLVIAAEHDALFTVKEQAALAARYGTQAAIVPGAGHDLMLDTAWQQAADLLVAWSDELDG